MSCDWSPAANSNKAIASRLDISVKTVETYKARAMEKLGFRSRVDVVRYGPAALACGPLLAFLDQRRDDLGDHFAGAHHHHLVADPHVLAGQVLLVVQGRRADGDAADVDRLEHRERHQVAGAADVPTTSSSFVVAVVGGNFQAIAQRGSRPTTPSSRQSARSSTLTTTPSIS